MLAPLAQVHQESSPSLLSYMVCADKVFDFTLNFIISASFLGHQVGRRRSNTPAQKEDIDCVLVEILY